MKIEILLLVLVLYLAAYDALTRHVPNWVTLPLLTFGLVLPALPGIASNLVGLPAVVLGLAFRRTGRWRREVVDGFALVGATRTGAASCVGDGLCLFIDCKHPGALADYTGPSCLGCA